MSAVFVELLSSRTGGDDIMMKILFLCTMHNSLSQRLYLILSKEHTVSIELALSDAVMIEAVLLAQPDLILCPFLTVAVPGEIYRKYVTLIVHPGPPGDAGPSSLDWLLIGDNGSESNHEELLRNQSFSESGRSHWAVSIIQATQEFDAGPVWAFEQFSVQIDEPGVTKSSLYRGIFSRAAVVAVLAAMGRVQARMEGSSLIQEGNICMPCVPLEYRQFSVTGWQQFQGGITCSRPLLRASDRGFDVNKETAKQISRKIRSADSQPGCLSSLFGAKLYLYGGVIDEEIKVSDFVPGSVIACRNGAVCIGSIDRKGIWITHMRRMKCKQDQYMWPKVPAILCLSSLELWNVYGSACGVSPHAEHLLTSPSDPGFHEIRVDFDTTNSRRLGYVYFDFYNGAMSTDQCTRLLLVLNQILETEIIHTMILMGGRDFFSNGVHLNVIEASADPALETWRNINRINDIVFFLLHELPKRGIRSIAALRGNCAAGGVALAAACDQVITGPDVVLNPSYRAIGLHGSEYHTISYRGRCRATMATSLLRNMLPLSADDARSIGLVDHVLHETGADLNFAIRKHVAMLSPDRPTWKTNVDLALSTLQTVQTNELAEMAKDCWSARTERFNTRRKAFVCKVKPTATPLRFATHRRQHGDTLLLDQEETDDFDSVDFFQLKAKHQNQVSVRSAALQSFMTGIQRVFDSAIQDSMPAEKTKDDSAQLLTFPCYYQS